MVIGDVCNRQVFTIDKKASLFEAGQRMRAHHVGALVVVEEEKNISATPLGIVTDRDLVVEVLSDELPLKQIAVGDVMSSELVTAHEEDDLFKIVRKMRQHGVRRIIILDRNKKLVGIVAMDDLLEILIDEIKSLVGIIRRERAVEERRRSSSV